MPTPEFTTGRCDWPGGAPGDRGCNRVGAVADYRRPMKPNLFITSLVVFALVSGCSKESEENPPEGGGQPGKGASNLSGLSQGGAGTGTGASSSGASEEKVFKNTYVEQNWPAEEEQNEWTNEFNAAATPEEKIEVLGRKQATGPEQLASVIRAALRVPDERLRIEAAQTIVSLLEEPEGVPDLVAAAVHDPSSEVRAYAMESVLELLPKTQVEVFKETINAPEYDVRKKTITELGRMHDKPSFEVLMTGLAHPDSAFREEVNFEINLMVDRKFESYEQANAWWESEGAPNYSDDMIYTGEDP